MTIRNSIKTSIGVAWKLARPSLGGGSYIYPDISGLQPSKAGEQKQENDDPDSHDPHDLDKEGGRVGRSVYISGGEAVAVETAEL